jgi:hypothetical protein
MMSPITVIGRASATSSIQSPLPLASRSSIRRAARARILEPGDRPWREGARDEFAVLDLFRRVQRDDGRVGREQVGGLDKRSVHSGERFVVAVQPHGVPVLGGHPEIPLDGLLDTRCQAVAEQRSAAAQLAEHLVWKAVAPQSEIGQIDCRSGHRHPRFTNTLTPRSVSEPTAVVRVR